MSAQPTFEEMEAKRQEMITSFKDIAAAMTRCVSIIEDYTRFSPSTISLANGGLSSSSIDKPEEEKKVKPKKEKKPKDPNAPKRPPSAYILFQNEIRDKIRKEHPELPYKVILPMISERWKALSDSEKQVYEEAYEDASRSFKVLDSAYKNHGQNLVAPEPVATATSPDSDDDEDSSESSSESSEEPAPAPVAAPTPKTPKHAAPAPAPITPQTLSAAVAATSEKPKKEKKRKNKDEEAVVAATAPAEPEKKIPKKKKKDTAAA